MKKKSGLLITMLLIYLTVFDFPLLFAESKQDETGKLQLSFFSINEERVFNTLELDDKPVTLNTGNQLKIYYQPLTQIYFYLYHIDRNNTITFFFPENFDHDLKPGKDFYIPAGAPDEKREGWITLNGKGPEVFYIIASTTRLQNLELLTKQYLKHGDGRRSKLHMHLKRLAVLSHYDAENTNIFQTEHSDLEKISGIVKGFRFDVQEIIVRDIYVKKITVNH